MHWGPGKVKSRGQRCCSCQGDKLLLLSGLGSQGLSPSFSHGGYVFWNQAGRFLTPWYFKYPPDTFHSYCYVTDYIPHAVLYIYPLDCFVTSNLYFSIPSPFSPQTPHLWQQSICFLYLWICFYFLLIILLFRFHILVKSYGICLSLPDRFHLAKYHFIFHFYL